MPFNQTIMPNTPPILTAHRPPPMPHFVQALVADIENEAERALHEVRAAAVPAPGRL